MHGRPVDCDKICTSNSTRWASQSTSLGKRPADSAVQLTAPTGKLLADGSTSGKRSRRQAVSISVSGGRKPHVDVRHAYSTMNSSKIEALNGEIRSLLSHRDEGDLRRVAGEEEGDVDVLARNECTCRCLSTHPAFREDMKDCVDRFAGTILTHAIKSLVNFSV